MRGKICKVKILEMDYAVCSCSTFAMTGALAWQVKTLIKLFFFGGDGMGVLFYFLSPALPHLVPFFFFSLLLPELSVWSDAKLTWTYSN